MKTHQDTLKKRVSERYAAIARDYSGCCGKETGCCGNGTIVSELGYGDAEHAGLEAVASLSLGCGNPSAIAALKPGETVIDLGSGGGFDCCLASRAVGPEGRVIGVDMTPEMILLARQNAVNTGVSNVEFHLGEIEHLPLPDGIADVIISNCVVNLSPDKPGVFNEAFRVLRPGGRLALADVVARRPLPEIILQDIGAQVGCIAGAAQKSDILDWLHASGFVNPAISPRDQLPETTFGDAEGKGLNHWIMSALITAQKPVAGSG